MSRTYKILLGFFLILLAGLVFLEANQPVPVNWNPSYSRIDKIPLGTYVFYKSLRENHPERMEVVKQPPYEFLMDTSRNGTYFFLNQSVAFGESELNKLLAWAKKGNTVFIAASYLGSKLLDTLQLETATAMSYSTTRSEPLLNFVNPQLKSDSAYHYKHYTDLLYFSKIDTATQTVLGVADLYEEPPMVKDKWVNFIKSPIGKGSIYLHLFPQAFGNYFMLLGENHEYAEKAMAYIDPKKTILWDGHYKIGKTFQTSPLYILLGNKYLKWAYYFVLIGAVLFVIFEGKRKQKSIEVVPPLQNKTHDFTRTVAGMYLDDKQHQAITEKQINLFLDYIRTHFRFDTQEIDEVFIENLSQRSGNSIEKTRSLFHYISELQKKPHIDKKELIELNQLIANFKSNN